MSNIRKQLQMNFKLYDLKNQILLNHIVVDGIEYDPVIGSKGLSLSAVLTVNSMYKELFKKIKENAIY